MAKNPPIAIIGAGFTGLTAAYELGKMGIPVEVFERDSKPGGLAVGFSHPKFKWSLEKHYHHLFTNDHEIISLAKEIGQNIIYPKSKTSLYWNEKIYPFNSPKDILTFSPLSLIDRMRVGIVSIVLKVLPSSFAVHFEKFHASRFARVLYGKNSFEKIWEPLLVGKFSEYKEFVNAAWFWARIKKRTLTLGYIDGGFQSMAEKLSKKVITTGGKIHYGTTFTTNLKKNYAKIIVTMPTHGFLKVFTNLPKSYRSKLESIPHLTALNLLLVLDRPFFNDGTYWLNINDRKYPFIAVVEHTNFIDKKNYDGKHLVYVGNYLPHTHPYLKMTKEELLTIFLPYLKKVNPSIQITETQLFSGPFAQPVFPVNYSRIIPKFETPIPDVYLANLDMVYPWDRGTNYAVELGKKIASVVAEKY